MALKKEEIEVGIHRKEQLNSFLDRYEIKSNEFAKMCSVSEQCMYSYRKGYMRITDKIWNVMQQAMKKYQADNIINGKRYQYELDEFIKKHKVPINRLASYSNVTEEGITNYLSGKWIYGFYWYIEEHVNSALSKRHAIKSQNNGIDYEVIPESVGQFTGRKDDGEDELYVGDIIQFDYNFEAHEGIIEWCDTELTFMVVSKISGLVFYLHEVDDAVTKIGNIHDNSKLLEGKV